MNSRTIAPLALAACLGALAVHKTASVLRACGGTPPAPFCSQSVSKIMSVPRNIAYDGSAQLMTIPFGVFVTQTGFPMQNVCPPGDIILNGELTLTCPAGSPITTSIGPLIVTTGLNALSAPIFVSPGLPIPSICTLTGFVDVTFPNGAVLRAECASELCLTEPSAGDPTLPRLEVELVNDPMNSPIQASHPGDPTGQIWRITNNDPLHAFDGVITGRSMNNSRMPIEILSGGPGSEPFAVSDPLAGDNFPIEFFNPGSDPFIPWWPCIDLTASPHDPDVPERSIPVALAPGETVFVGLAVRPWGMCASGSGCRVPLEVSGVFGDGTSGFACVNGVAYADDSVAPLFDCDDGGSGSVSQFSSKATAPDSLGVFVNPGSDPFVGVVKLQLVELNLQSSAPIQILPQPGTLGPSYGRVQHEVSSADPDQPLAAVDSFFDIVYRIDFQPAPDGPPVNLELMQMMLLEGIPGGFENTAPILKGTVAASSPEFAVDSFFDIFLQISGGPDSCDDGNPCANTFHVESIVPDGPSSVLIHLSGQVGGAGGSLELPGPVSIDGQTLDAAQAQGGPGADLRGPGFVDQIAFRTDVRAFAYLGAAPPCPWDLSGSGTVGSADLGFMLGCWGPYTPGDPCEAADFSGTGSVGSADLAALLGNWGPCP